METRQRIPMLPLPVRGALRKLGADIRDARRRRRIPSAVLAERASISRGTLHKLEAGEPTVSLGSFATVIHTLGMTERFSDLADVKFDALGQTLDDERLPQRIRSRKVK